MSDTTIDAAIELLNATDPRILKYVGHDRRRRMADTLRLWAWAADEADRLARQEVDLGRVLTRFDRPRSGVIAALDEGDRAP